VTAVRVRSFTDPACPFSFAAEPVRLRLAWLYGDQLQWDVRMAVLRETPPRSWSASRAAASLRLVAEVSGMPISWRQRVRGVATIHACRVAVATRLRWPEREAAILRRLRVLGMAGELLDDSDTFELAAAQAGLPVAELAAFCAEPEVEAALRADMALARGHRCPELEIAGRRVDGRSPLPGLERRPDPASVQAVLSWAGMPLATAEVAAVCARPLSSVRAELSRVARYEGGYWGANVVAS
jgi:predicted DsbA family dithiol-disulfide isomerase